MKEVIFFGYIIEINDSLTGGRISDLDAFPDYKIDYKVDSTIFEIANSSTPIYLNKLIVFNRKHNDVLNKTEIVNISDFDISRHNQFTHIFKRVMGHCEIINPNHHPWLLDYFIENKIHYNSYYREYNMIIEANDLIKSFDTMSFDKALHSYKVELYEEKISRPGKDDSAGIYIVSERNYRRNDNYLDLYLPNFNRKIAYDKYYSSYIVILEELWENIGGEDKRRELEMECKKIYEENIEKYKLLYNRTDHLNHLIKYRNHLEREFRKKVHSKFKQAILF